MSTVLLVGVLALAASNEETIDQRRQQREDQRAQFTLAAWLKKAPPAEVDFADSAQYPEASHLIERFLLKKTKRMYEVTAIAFLQEGHTPEFIYGRVFRANIKDQNERELVVDFLLQKKSGYLEVTAWQRARDPQRAAEAAGG